MSDDDDKPKRFRSPPYPMFDLGKAVDRASELHAKANAHAVGVQVLAEAWGMKSVDGKVWRTAASLIQYGLLQDSGTGKTRKFQITDSAKRIILDANPDSDRRRDAIQKAALGPTIHKELWDLYGNATGLSNTVIKTHLTIDREEGGEAPYSPAAADEVITTYRSTLDYAGLDDSAKVSQQQEDTAEKDNADLSPKPPKVRIGDFVRWVSGEVVQFEARKVDWVSEDGTHLRVFGSPTGIPMDQIEKVPPPRAAPAVISSVQTESGTQATGRTGGLKATAYVENGRLQLTADIGLNEIDDLREMLEGYKTILKFLN